jgi:hypothetical protein
MTKINSNGPKDLSPEEIVDEASRPDVDQIHREVNGDDGSGPDLEETPHGSEERKRETEKEAEENDG